MYLLCFQKKCYSLLKFYYPKYPYSKKLSLKLLKLLIDDHFHLQQEEFLCTPLAAGLVAAGEVVRPLLLKEPNLRPLVVLLSDGRANLRLDGSKGNGLPEVLEVAADLGDDDRLQWIVVDTETAAPGRGLRLGLAGRVADALRAPCHTIDQLRADELAGLVREHL